MTEAAVNDVVVSFHQLSPSQPDPNGGGRSTDGGLILSSSVKYIWVTDKLDRVIERFDTRPPAISVRRIACSGACQTVMSLYGDSLVAANILEIVAKAVKRNLRVLDSYP